MAEAVHDGPRLLGSWKRIGSADRRAILDALPAERRQQFEDLLGEAQAELAADRQFLVYSNWLRPVMEWAVGANDAQAKALKPAVREALRRAHDRLAPESAAANAASGMFERARRTLTGWVDRL